MNNEGVAAKLSRAVQDAGYSLGNGVSIMQELITLLEEASPPRELVDGPDVNAVLDWDTARRTRIKQAEIWIKDVDGS